jgi:hypothetical protein
MKLLAILKEIANDPYALNPAKEEIEGNFNNYVDYNFETDSGREYYVRFDSKWAGRGKEPDQKYNWATELTFFPVQANKTGDTEVGGENFGKILATVMKALRQFIQSYKPEYVFWKGIIGKDETKPSSTESTKRQRIYNAILDRESKSISGYTPNKGDKKSGIVYGGDIPIKGSKPIFDYPEEPSIRNKADVEKRVSRFNLSRG